MDIEFAAARLLRASRSLSEATRHYGVLVGRKYIQRLVIIRAVDEFSQLYGLSALRLHQLSGNRAGQYAVTLTGNYRLIIEPTTEESVRILGVEDYHGE